MKSFLAAFSGIWVIFFMALSPVKADDVMAFPLACQPGQSCWIIGYPDLSNAGDAPQDYMCGPGAAPNDVFWRLGLPDAGTIKTGVAVVAVQDGTVVDASDGVPDVLAASKADIKVGTPACGNGVIIDHGDGLESAYCHMRQGSVRVQKGEQVNKGQIIGMAGQSGIAFWPQLGFSIRKDGFFEDPITGSSAADGCGHKPNPLIAMPKELLEYQPVAIVSLGFSSRPVTEQALVSGALLRFTALDASEKAMNLWTMILNVHKDDQIEIRLRDPRGRTFYYTDITADKDQNRMPLNVTRQRGYTNWRSGLYVGEITVTRKIGVFPYSVSRAVSLEID